MYGIRCETVCPPNFYGSTCSIECLKNDDCANGHWTCNSSGDRVCKMNWLGSNCNAKTISPVVDPECPNNLLNNGGCYNGGTCCNKGCCCAPGFTGQYCQTQVNNCIDNGCANNATCINGINAYTCSCPTGFTGQFCQIALNPCQNSPCNQGICYPTPSSASGFYCICNSGWTGTMCNNILDNWCDILKTQHFVCWPLKIILMG